MARFTAELAARAVGSKYDLVLIAAIRARELRNGYASQVDCNNGAVVTALREIEEGHIGREYLKKVNTYSSYTKKTRR
jgi:DNA-directed RNA polymerase omega subunit